MSSESEIVDVLSRVANIFLKAVDALETRMMIIEQRIDELERGGAPSGGRREPAPMPSMPAPVAQDPWRAPPPSPPPQQYPPQPAQGYQARPQSYPPPQQSQPASYPPAQPQGAPYGSPGAPSQGPPGAGPPRPSSPLNVRQAVTGELKEVFAKMRARAEGR
jgi:hypothetical protein